MANVSEPLAPRGPTSEAGQEVSRSQSHAEEQPVMYLTLLEEALATPAPVLEMSEIWAELPEAVMENVLLYLPAVVQARFCTVSKLWWKLIMSSRFREQTALIALRSGKTMAVCSALEPFDTVERLKVAKMMLPADVDESDLKHEDNWCAQGGLLALIVCGCSTGGMRIFVFNPVEKTPCQELPLLPWKDHVGDLALVVEEDSSFRVALSYRTPQDRGEESFYGFYICSSSANGKPPMTWNRFSISRSSIDKAGWDLGNFALGGLRLYLYFLTRRFIYAVMRHRGYGTAQLFILVRLSAKAEYISTVSPVSPTICWIDVHFVPSYPSETLFAVLPDRTIFKLDDGSTVWTLVSSPPEEVRGRSKVAAVGFVGDRLLMLVVFNKSTKAEVIAYHTLTGLWTRGCHTNNSPSDCYPRYIAPRRASAHG